MLHLNGSKEPHSKLWGITGKGATPHRVTNGTAFIPPASWGVFSGDFYKDTLHKAKVAAVTANKTLGEWLEEAIREKIAKEG